jgi:hypothetical protein
VHLIGRRGFVQSAWTSKELREILSLPRCRVVMDESFLQLNPESEVAQLFLYLLLLDFACLDVFRSYEPQGRAEERSCQDEAVRTAEEGLEGGVFMYLVETAYHKR